MHAKSNDINIYLRIGDLPSTALTIPHSYTEENENLFLYGHKKYESTLTFPIIIVCNLLQVLSVIEPFLECHIHKDNSKSSSAII